ncbi:flagellar basal body P-ring formation chaperone FlgA [Phaeovulum sp.]|uniref:flagellar basal body P-ring formation chaperone FlgA n=1 Tax=Phaeovulum sp. TaxID=2934796 RepID=UPI0039E3D1C7
MIWRKFGIATILFMGLTATGHAEVLVATRTLRAQTIIAQEDVALQKGADETALSRAEAALGRETRIAIYAGRPIRPQDIGPPAIVDRNQIVMMSYQRGFLIISTEGRALERGGVGDTIHVLNATSRVTVNAKINADGSLTVVSQ